MLKGQTITTIREYLQHTHPITDLNRDVFTYYVIEYDGTNECKQDISRFIGGFPYGDLTLVNTALINQHWASRYREDYKENQLSRTLEDCIEHINIGDWVVLSCGKFFVIPEADVVLCKLVWRMEKVDFDVERFKQRYSEGNNLYGYIPRTNNKKR